MRRYRWQLLLSVLSVLPVSSVLHAQAPAARQQLVALRDSVVQLSSADEASALASSEREALSRDKADAFLLMQAALAQLRVGQLSTDRVPLDRAQTLFDEAIYRAPDDWPWPWYGLALADLALDSMDAVVKSSMHSGAGVYYHDAALHALGRALKADSSFDLAAQLLGDVLLPFGERSLNDETVRAVRRAARSNTAASPWLALGRIYRNLHQTDSALHAFRHYVELGGDSGLGLLEQARSLYVRGDTGPATTAYYRGASVQTPLGRESYRRDVAWVATPEELAAFDVVPADSVGSFVRGFWAKRDAEDLRAPGERLAEHVRRWRYVFEHFQLSARAEGTPQANGADCAPNPNLKAVRMPSNVAELRAVPLEVALFEPGIYAATWRGKRQVDDRGLIYMRHGEPDMRAAYHGAKTMTHPDESWRYHTPSGTLIFHFCGSMALGTQAPTTLVEMLPLDTDVLGSRMGLDVRYQYLAWHLGDNGGRMMLQELIREGWHNIKVGLSTDEFRPLFKHQLEPSAQFYAVGEPGEVLVVFALSGDRLQGQPLPDGGTGYPVSLRIVATNAKGDIARIDTTRRFYAKAPLAKDQFLFGLERLRLAPGTWNVRLLVMQDSLDAGGAIERIGTVVPGPATFGLSDLVLGREGSGLTWQSGAGRIPLNPLDVFPNKGSAELYYELHDAHPGATYRTDIEVKGIRGDSKAAVHLSFEEQAHDSFVRARRSIGLDKLDPGKYQLTVTVAEEGSTRTATQERILNVE
jgi:tetratricopeptide (TPR) repeat protein